MVFNLVLYQDKNQTLYYKNYLIIYENNWKIIEMNLLLIYNKKEVYRKVLKNLSIMIMN